MLIRYKLFGSNKFILRLESFLLAFLLPFLFAVPAFTVQPGANVPLPQNDVKTGDEVFVEKYLGMIKGRTVGIITNQTGVLPDGRHIVDVLSKISGVKVVALFSPEHGIRGITAAGATVNDSVDEETGIRIYSLYGKTEKPTREMLKGIDFLIYDIQDVGVRFYTFISTLNLTLEAAAENNIKYIVLDRPDMLRPDMVDGPVLIDSLKSFIGIQPIPSVYGMTPGELATMINDCGCLADDPVHIGGEKRADLTVIRMENYHRKMWYDQTGLRWVMPSPNLPDMRSVEVYPGSVLIEATNVSEGRGTDKPFEYIGAPFMDGKKLARLLNSQHLNGVKFEAVDFTPHTLPSAPRPKWENIICHGVNILVTDRDEFRPVEMGINLVWAINRLYPDSLKIIKAYFDKLAGMPQVRLMLKAGKAPAKIISSWRENTRKFEISRKRFLLYH
ncbi:MAG: exo-beta-N-acetylmuramidase NamZ domain-containing protein [Candidatus Kryptoniota bacterium]